MTSHTRSSFQNAMNSPHRHSMLAAAFLLASTPQAMARPPAPDLVPLPEVAAWARSNLHAVDRVTLDGDLQDLEPLRAIIGKARIVSFGEGMHGADEPLQFRNRMFRFLVERLGFNAIAIESGVTEGFAVNRYVLGAGDERDLNAVVSRGFSFGFDRLPQETDLVRWMRRYNEQPGRLRKIEFFGLDVPGSPTDMQSTLWMALDYLQARDAALARGFRARIADLIPHLTLDRASAAPGQYTGLTQAERDRMTATIADVIAQFETHETEYVSATSVRDYAMAYHAAVAARQVDDYLRQLPLGWTPAQGVNGLYGTVASADHSKAENLRWVLDQLGPDARVLVFMHRDHLAYTRSTVRLPPPADRATLPPMVGMYLKQRYGEDLVMIAHLFGRNASHCGAPTTTAPAGGVEALLSGMAPAYFLLDLRTAPSDVSSWLHRDHELFGEPPLNTTAIGAAYDAVFFSRSVQPAIPCHR